MNTMTRQRINITLPQETLALLDHVAKRGGRSALVDTAVHYYVRKVGTKKLQQELARGYRARAKRDLLIVEEWSTLTPDAWPE